MHLFGTQTFSFAKSPFAVQDCIWVSGLSEDSTETVLDYFAGSGTTGHAAINLNRDDDGARKFILVEQGEYFDTVLLPRIAKVIAAPEWKDGKPKPGQSMQALEGEDAETHWSARSPKIVQILRLERYEDSLDALELPDETEARRAGQMSFTVDPLRYVYEAATAGASVALNTARLSEPFDLTIPQVRDGAPVPVPVDIAATALLLLGLHPVRVRDLRGKAGRNGKNRYLLIEARPNGEDKALHLVVLRDVDESITGAALKAHAQAESDWLTDVIRREFGRASGDYGCVWHNRDLYLKGAQGRSLDSEVARRMLERAPVTRAQ
jgi:adenine-specific DNA-methyltransferase